MDAATALPTSSKKQKHFGEQDASRDKDFISKLPEDILVRILSRLSTEQAIRTCILSKRWKYLWMYVPVLSFMVPSFSRSSKKRSDDENLELWETFFRSIERALTLRNAYCLRDLCIWFNMQVGASRVHSWLSAAVKNNVQKLSLSLPDREKFVFPISLFTSESLSSLWLCMQSTLKIPCFVCLSGLRFLSLGNVVFPDDHSAQEVFSGCPVLEQVEFSDCDWRNITGSITIDNPTLKSFSFSDTDFSDRFFNCKIRISALNLETLIVTGYPSVELLPNNVPSLDSASIDGLEASDRFVKLLSGLESVRSLGLSNEILEVM